MSDATYTSQRLGAAKALEQIAALLGAGFTGRIALNCRDGDVESFVTSYSRRPGAPPPPWEGVLAAQRTHV